MSKQVKDDLVKSLAAVMTLTENLIMQLGEIAKIYDQMPDEIKREVAKAQVKARVDSVSKYYVADEKRKNRRKTEVKVK